MQKVKVLFVVGSLCRAGAERFAYEIDAALNKTKFETSILCLEKKLEISANWNERYYEKKHLELGTSIQYIDQFLRNKKTTKPERIFHRITRNKFRKYKSPWKSNLAPYLDSFDVIHWMGEYTFIHSIPESIKEKSLIHSMSAKFQDPNIYNSYDFDYPYHFISGFKIDDGEYSQFKNIEHTFFPLVLAIPVKTNRWKFSDKPIKKIGIFTRLSSYKPLDPYFYAFHLLLDKLPHCELHVYGNGDPAKEGMTRYLENLGIKDKVFFRGHQEDIAQTAIEEQVDLSWFQGYNNHTPAGYAGFDICTTGTPLICWDFHEKPFNPINEIYPHFKNLTDFVNRSYELLTEVSKAEKLSQIQFEDIIQTRNVNNHIHFLEELYQDFKK